MENKVDRLKKVIRHLICYDKIGYESIQKELTEKLHSEKSVVSRALNGDEKYLTDNFLVKLNNAFGNEFNLDWLLKGEGDMINKISTDVNNENSPNSMIMSGIIGDGQSQTKGVSDETVKDLANGYQNVIRTYQEQTDKLVSVIDKLIEKYGK